MLCRVTFKKTRKCQSKCDTDHFYISLNRLSRVCISTVFSGLQEGANLFSRIRPRRADRVNDPTVQREMERAQGGAKPADRRLVSAKRSTTHSSATSWEPPLQSHHWNAASQSRRTNTHAFLYYRKAKNKNTKFKQAPRSRKGLGNSTKRTKTHQRVGNTVRFSIQCQCPFLPSYDLALF